MGDDGSFLADEPQGLPRGRSGAEGGPGPSGEPSPPSHEPDADLTLREPYLRRVLDEFEAGHLEPYDYTRRVLAINAAATPEEMSAIVEGVPDGSGGGGTPARRGLDAVDLALLRSSRSTGARTQRTRYVALAVVFALFAVLIAIGMWLAAHVHGAASPGALIDGAVSVTAPAWF